MKHCCILLLLSLLSTISSCSSSGLGGPGYRIYHTESGQEVELSSMVEDIGGADIIFMGEEHDNDVGHALQLATLEALIAQGRELILTMEQFETDVQGQVDLYMAGAFDREELLRTSRPWGNYLAHYAPLVELAKAHNIPVIGANIPRPIASRIFKEGVQIITTESHAPKVIWTAEPQYAQLFAEAMGKEAMGDRTSSVWRGFVAQCAKDEKMAESISRSLVRAWAAGKKPLIVHINGKFHSAHGLGTVSRLLRRHPSLDVRLIGMTSDDDRDRALTEQEQSEGQYMWLVTPQPED
jgi:uncharacterized iron-regulated protein